MSHLKECKHAGARAVIDTVLNGLPFQPSYNVLITGSVVLHAVLEHLFREKPDWTPNDVDIIVTRPGHLIQLQQNLRPLSPKRVARHISLEEAGDCERVQSEINGDKYTTHLRVKGLDRELNIILGLDPSICVFDYGFCEWFIECGGKDGKESKLFCTERALMDTATRSCTVDRYEVTSQYRRLRFEQRLKKYQERGFTIQVAEPKDYQGLSQEAYLNQGYVLIGYDKTNRQDCLVFSLAFSGFVHSFELW